MSDTIRRLGYADHCQHCGTMMYDRGVFCSVACESKCRHPRWPRGKYNGRRIVGASVKLKFDVTEWRWIPSPWNKYGKAFLWLCFFVWVEWEYEIRTMD